MLRNKEGRERVEKDHVQAEYMCFNFFFSWDSEKRNEVLHLPSLLGFLISEQDKLGFSFPAVS